MESTTTSQTLVYYQKSNAFQTTWTGPLYAYLNSSFEMESTNHFPLNTGGDDGGPWLLHRKWDICSPASWTTGVFKGQFTLGKPTAYVPFGTGMVSNATLIAQGATAIARCSPTNPMVSVGSDIAEQVGSPMPSIPAVSLWKERASAARSAGDEYLNVEFGWLPLVSDIKKFCYTVRHTHKVLDSFRKGSGHKTRVGYSFPDEIQTATFSSGAFFPYPSKANTNFITGILDDQVKRETWFSGCFKYYVPMGDDTWSKMRRYEQYASKLYGLRLTPDVLWNAAPWTWALDWFGNAGDVLKNVGALSHDGLVMQYGYIMAHSRREMTMTSLSSWAPTSRRTGEEWKQRLNATPYGFGVNLSTLSSTQIAILAALGLSKGVPGFSH